MSLFSAQALACTYPNGTQAVRGLDFRLEPGELVGLIGPDGAGKTSTFKMLVGLLRPTSGRLDLELGRREIGYVPQTFSLSPDLSVAENLRLQAQLFGMKDAEPRILELMQSVDLDRFADRMAGALSGGMKQKLALCNALLPQPRLLLLDEPTTGVDPVSRREFWAMLHAIHADGVAILFSTPYMDEAEYAHRMALMHEGRILAEGDLDSFRSSLGGVVLELRAAERRAVEERLRALMPLDLNSEGDRIRVRFPEQAIEALTARVAALEGVLEIRSSEPSLEDFFLHALQEAEGSHA